MMKKGLIILLVLTLGGATVVSAATNKHPSEAFSGQINLGGSTDHTYHFTDDVVIDNPGNITGNNSGVIFIEGNLTIGPMPTNRLSHGSPNSGLVFVVKGDVNIDKTITQVDAVIISEGTICTASENNTCFPGYSDPATTSQLVINGSLIALNESAPIQFRRTLTDNAIPAEKINHQVKYLVILRDLLSDTYQKWTEVP